MRRCEASSYPRGLEGETIASLKQAPVPGRGSCLTFE